MRIEKNVGDMDRVLRVLIGIGLLLVVPLGLVGPGASWTLFGLAGLAVLLTGVFRVCITYKPPCASGPGPRSENPRNLPRTTTPRAEPARVECRRKACPGYGRSGSAGWRTGAGTF
jgi:hypothetical protein